MGWLPSIFGGTPTPKDDPLKNLDPKLREFLDKESPVKFRRAAAEDRIIAEESAAKAASALSTIAARPRSAGSPAPSTPAVEDSTAVPKESQFQDGRYAHLWKTYRPLKTIEDEGKSANEKMADVLDGYKARKDSIGRAALENCALQQEEWMECLRKGSWEDRVQLCRHQIRRFERCYNMQHRFLRTFGYQADPSRGPDFNDAIQVHADHMYQRLIAHESAVATAKANGLPEPEWIPTDPSTIFIPGVTPSPISLPTAEKTQWEEKLSKTPEDERPFEQAALEADFSVRAQTAQMVSKMKEEESREIEARKKAGRATLVDHVLGVFRGAGEGK